MGSLIVYFDGQFWVGLVTGSLADGSEGVARVVFGPEPTNAQVIEWARRQYLTIELLPADSTTAPTTPKGNPKRRMREAQRALREPVIGTASHRALQQALEVRKHESDCVRRAATEDDEQRRYQARVEKKKQKKRGR
jgi:hypothetical protein